MNPGRVVISKQTHHSTVKKIVQAEKHSRHFPGVNIPANSPQGQNMQFSEKLQKRLYRPQHIKCTWQCNQEKTEVGLVWKGYQKLPLFSKTNIAAQLRIVKW